jgi:hypothetical protein
MKKFVAGVVGVLMLSACTPATGPSPITKSTAYVTKTVTPKPSTSTTSAPPATTEPAPSEMPVPEPQDSAQARFGERYKYSDGLIVSVSRPVEFTPSPGTDGVGSHSVKFVLTYTNTSNSPFDPSHVTIKVLSQGNEGVDIYDPANGLRGEWNLDPLQPGRYRQYVVGFSVDGSEELQVTVLSSLDRYEAVTFSG